MDVVAMSGEEAYMSVKGAADLDVVNNLPGVDNKRSDEKDAFSDIDDGGTVTAKVLEDDSVVDIYA